jgi:isocitrate dehydrogenase
MLTIRGRFNGISIELLDKVSLEPDAHVLVIVLDGELERAAARLDRQGVSVPLLTPEHYLEGTKRAIASAKPQSQPQRPFTVGEIMTEKVVVVSPKTAAIDAMHLMAREGITSVIVEPGADGDWGIMTIRDVLDRIVRANRSSEHVTAGEMATRPLITVSREMPLQECSELMVDKRIRRAVVMEFGRPVGIVSETDIFRVVERHGWAPQMTRANQMQFD